MADRFKFAEVRQKVIDIMKMDLLGPSSEEEVLSQNPRFEYLVGMLAPQTNEDDGSNEQEVDGDASFEGDDNYTAGEEDDNEPVSTNRFKTPSSIGISFYVESGTSGFNVDVSWGDYVKSTDKTVNKDGKEINVNTYTRHPQKETIAIELDSFSKSQEYPLVCECMNLDILLDQILSDALAGANESVRAIQRRYPSLSEREASEIFSMISSAAERNDDSAELIITASPSFALRVKPTKVVVNAMLSNAKSSILITGYSLSDYFSDLVDCVIRKSQEGVLVKFFVNDIDSQKSFDRLCRYKGRFLRIYNYPKQEDKMSALHAKVISVDQQDTLITSANLSYHGQEGNIELGTKIHSRDLARQVEDVFTKLVFKKAFVEL